MKFLGFRVKKHFEDVPLGSDEMYLVFLYYFWQGILMVDD